MHSHGCDCTWMCSHGCSSFYGRPSPRWSRMTQGPSPLFRILIYFVFEQRIEVSLNSDPLAALHADLIRTSACRRGTDACLPSRYIYIYIYSTLSARSQYSSSPPPPLLTQAHARRLAHACTHTNRGPPSLACACSDRSLAPLSLPITTGGDAEGFEEDRAVAAGSPRANRLIHPRRWRGEGATDSRLRPRASASR